MKYLLFSLLVTGAMVSQAQETDTVPRLPWPSDSIWHLKGTHKKVIRQARAWFIHDNRWNDTLHKWIGPPPEVQRYKYDTTDEAFARKLDTIDVWKLVTDTIPGFEYPARMVHVKEVREQHNTLEQNRWWADCMNCTYSDYWQHLKYLTASGRPLPKGKLIMETEILPAQEPEYAVTPDPPPPITTGQYLPTITFITDSASVYVDRGDTILTTRILGAGIWTGHAEDDRYKAGDGVKKDHSDKYGEVFVLDIEWMPRRLQRLYKKHYHLK